MRQKVVNAVAEIAGCVVFVAIAMGFWGLSAWMDANDLFSFSGWRQLISGAG